MQTNGEAESTDAFHAIAHPTRRAILDLLRLDDMSAPQIASRLRESEEGIRTHVKVLQDAALIQEKRGRSQALSVVPGALAEVDHWLTSFRPFKLVRMSDFKRLVEAEKRNGR
ncbi:helix-turn-helix domain-containing protein [Aquabacter sp. CN5-332]|uniref:helix-turn-helix domain-containing protein n=1 Tax=Aquabacter sp. CN5-332 TaxID=3156608 RepID=UPI0032B34C1B